MRIRARALLTAVLYLTGTAAGVTAAAPAHAIAHGADATDGSYPFSVKLTMTGLPTADGGSRDSSCSGGLIAPRWIVTAGHCFRDAGNNRVSRPVARRTTATVGRADLRTRAGHVATVVAVRQSGTADVALARLDRAITDIVPLQLSRTAPRIGERVRLTGYGFTEGDATRAPLVMQTGQFAVTSVDRTVVGMTGRSPRADTSPCPHDSGGPYFTEGADGTAVLVSVVSRGPTCPHTGADLSGRIDTIAGWIRDIIGADATQPRTSPSSKPSPRASPPVWPGDDAVAAPGRSRAGLSYPLAGLSAGVVLVAAVAVTAAKQQRRRRRREYTTRGVRRHRRHSAH